MSLSKRTALLVASAFAVVSLGVFCSEASAIRFPRATRAAIAAANGVNKNKQPEPQKVSNQQLREALQLLRSLNHTLKNADHDYGGHRAAAIKSIGAAEHQLKVALEHAHKRPKTGKTPGTGTKNPAGKGEPEPQALSDQQLAQAVPVLKNTIQFLSQADHDYGGHRAQAIKDLQIAVTDLEKALKFSKKNDQQKP